MPLHSNIFTSLLLTSLITSLITTILPVQAKSTDSAYYPINIQSCNRTVTFNQKPKAAISNDVNLTEMMLVLGLQKQMVGFTGISGWKTLDPVLRKEIGELPELSPKYPSKGSATRRRCRFLFCRLELRYAARWRCYTSNT